MAGSKFKEGDHVTFLPGLIYPEELERQILAGNSFIVASADDELGIAQVESVESGWFFTVHRDWLKAVEVTSECVCDLLVGGCVCGTMESEMRTKGYRRNPVTKLWEKIDEV